MEEIKVKAIVLNSTDFKEKDKIVNLFSLELGLISVIIKNCRTSSYKLKFAYSPFSFGEFELFKKGEVLVLKTATLIENFFSITEDYDKFLIGNNILEIILKTNKVYESNQILFINVLKILNNIAFTNANENLLLIKFMLGTLKVNGFKLNFKYCNNCSLPYVNKIYLNLNNGELECGSCRSDYSILLENEEFNLLKQINNTEVDNIIDISCNENNIKNVLKLLSLNLENRFNIRLNSKRFY